MIRAQTDEHHPDLRTNIHPCPLSLACLHIYTQGRNHFAPCHWESFWAPGRTFPIILLIWHEGPCYTSVAPAFPFYASCDIYPYSSPEDFHGRVVKAVTTVYISHRTPKKTHTHTHIDICTHYPDKVAHLGTPSGGKSFLRFSRNLTTAQFTATHPLG